MFSFFLCLCEARGSKLSLRIRSIAVRLFFMHQTSISIPSLQGMMSRGARRAVRDL